MEKGHITVSFAYSKSIISFEELISQVHATIYDIMNLDLPTLKMHAYLKHLVKRKVASNVIKQFEKLLSEHFKINSASDGTSISSFYADVVNEKKPKYSLDEKIILSAYIKKCETILNFSSSIRNDIVHTEWMNAYDEPSFRRFTKDESKLNEPIHSLSDLEIYDHYTETHFNEYARFNYMAMECIDKILEFCKLRYDDVAKHETFDNYEESNHYFHNMIISPVITQMVRFTKIEDINMDMVDAFPLI